MINFIDSLEFSFFYLILILILTGLNLIFFILRKTDNLAFKLKVLIIILLGISIILFVLKSITSLSGSSETLINTEDIIINNIPLFLLSISTVLFLYSIYSSDEDIVKLEKPPFFKSRKGNIKIGRVMERGHKKHKFFLSLEDLEKHMFICGATGTGKTNFLQHLLINFTKTYKIPFMLVEFKGEYHFLQNKIENFLIIRPGENFSINIFNPEGVLPEVHAERVFDILKSGKFLDEQAEFSPQMEKVLVEILTKVCKTKKFQSWEGFYEYCKGYANSKKKEIPMLSQTLISITNRIRRFSLGSLKALFDTDHKLKVRDLFNINVLFDLSSIIRLGGEKEDALFFLNMVLKYLWDKNLTRGAYNFQGIKHITIVEDAQYFAPKDLTRQNKLTTYLEDIALLQRGTGECLISLATHPDISEEILANCGVLVCFKTHIDREFLCKLLNLDAEHEDYLSILEKGQCIVRVNSIKRPFILQIPFLPREWLTISEIQNNNKIVLSKLDKSDDNKSKILEKKQKHFFRKVTEKSVLFLKRIRNHNEITMVNNKSKNQRVEEELRFITNKQSKEDLEQLSSIKNGFNKKKIIRPSLYDTEEDFKKLEDYIEKLYEEQEKRKKSLKLG